MVPDAPYICHIYRPSFSQKQRTSSVRRFFTFPSHLPAHLRSCFVPVPTQTLCYALSEPLSSHTYTNGLASLAKELGVWISAGIHELPGDDDGEDVKRESKNQSKVFK